jgi:hypothetical protein
VASHISRKTSELGAHKDSFTREDPKRKILVSGLTFNDQQHPGAPHPRFPVKRRGFRELHAPFLKERRTRGYVQGSVQEIRGISLVFCEMWDTTNLTLRFPALNSPQKSLTP